jgi:hypothetical protein
MHGDWLTSRLPGFFSRFFPVFVPGGQSLEA